MNRELFSTMAVVIGSAAIVLCALKISADDGLKPAQRDPAAWGDDHVGKPLPEYITGDECLFCHRKIGSTWPTNRHQLTIRPVTPDDAVCLVAD